MDGTKTGRNASRQIQELVNADYIAVKDQQGKNRKIVICHVDSRMNPAKSGEDDSGNLAKNGDDGDSNLAKSGDPTSPKMAATSPNLVTTSPNLAGNLAKNGEQTSLITNLKEQEKEQEKETEKDKETDCFFSADKPIKNQEDAMAVFLKARDYWNGRGLKPECRNIIIPPAEAPGILCTFQHYSPAEIKNAIGNYAWHKTKAGPEYSEPPPYGSLYGFLKKGVERYFDDNALDQQFKKEARK